MRKRRKDTSTTAPIRSIAPHHRPLAAVPPRRRMLCITLALKQSLEKRHVQLAVPGLLRGDNRADWASMRVSKEV